MKIYRECARESYSFFITDATLLASDSPEFKKKISTLIKMTVTDQLKILDDKIKSNQTQYNVDILGAKISALLSG